MLPIIHAASANQKVANDIFHMNSHHRDHHAYLTEEQQSETGRLADSEQTFKITIIMSLMVHLH